MANCNAYDTVSRLSRCSYFAAGVIVARAREIHFWLKKYPELKAHVVLAIREGIESFREANQRN